MSKPLLGVWMPDSNSSPLPPSTPVHGALSGNADGKSVQRSGVLGGSSPTQSAEHGFCFDSSRIMAAGCGTSGEHAFPSRSDCFCFLPVGVHPCFKEPIVDVACGGKHVIVITGSDRVFSWGSNMHGQCGIGAQGLGVSAISPTEVTALRGRRMIQVAAARAHSLALTADGAGFSWGQGADGRLGHGNQYAQHQPLRIHSLSMHTAAIAAGNACSFFISAIGQVWACGSDENGQLACGQPRSSKWSPSYCTDLAGFKVTSLSCGSSFCVARCADSSCVSWGRQTSGCLGRRKLREGAVYKPACVDCLPSSAIVSVRCGQRHAVALTRAGQVYSWGDGEEGALGTAPARIAGVPARVESLSGKVVTQISCGNWHTLVLTSSGEVFGWGDASRGRLPNALSGKHHVAALRRRDEQLFRLAPDVDDNGVSILPKKLWWQLQGHQVQQLLLEPYQARPQPSAGHDRDKDFHLGAAERKFRGDALLWLKSVWGSDGPKGLSPVLRVCAGGACSILLLTAPTATITTVSVPPPSAAGLDASEKSQASPAQFSTPSDGTGSTVSRINVLYKRACSAFDSKDFITAASLFEQLSMSCKQALKGMETSSKHAKSCRHMLTAALMNTATIYLQDRTGDCLRLCDELLNMKCNDKIRIKALVRKARALQKLRTWQASIDVCDAILAMDPSNAAAKGMREEAFSQMQALTAAQTAQLLSSRSFPSAHGDSMDNGTSTPGTSVIVSGDEAGSSSSSTRAPPRPQQGSISSGFMGTSSIFSDGAHSASISQPENTKHIEGLRAKDGRPKPNPRIHTSDFFGGTAPSTFVEHGWD